MKKVLFGLLILTTLGLILAACLNPSIEGADASLPRAVALNDADRAVAAVIKPVVSGKTNASGKDISSNAQGAAVPGMYFFWDPKQKNNGFLKVEASLFDNYKSFVLTTKEANKYWDFLILHNPAQPRSPDGYYVYSIPKQEKNINGVWISDYVDKPFALQDYDYTEFVGDVPNPDRGYYRPNDGWTVPVTGGLNQSASPSVGNTTINGTSVTANARLIHCYFGLQRYTTKYNRSGTVGQDGPITEDGLAYIRNTLQRVREIGGMINPRFTYDPSGNYENWNGAEPEGLCGIPGYENLTWWEYHIQQVKPILQDYEDVLFAVDLGWFGPWSEMHTTRANNRVNYVKLANAMLDAVPGEVPLLSHSGAFLAWYNDTYGTSFDYSNMETLPPRERHTPEARFGMFNDSYGNGVAGGTYPDAGIANDNGSLSEGYQLCGPNGDQVIYDVNNPYYEDPTLSATIAKLPPGRGDGSFMYYENFKYFDRSKMLRWMGGQKSYYGGEVILGNLPYGYFPSIPREASIAGTAYLNSGFSNHSRWSSMVYNEANIDVDIVYPTTGKQNLGYSIPGYTDRAFFDPVYDGRNCEEFMRDRLGYRLVLREAYLQENVRAEGFLKFKGKIQNVGFGNVVNDKNVYAVLKNVDTGDTYITLTDLDTWDWQKDLDGRASNVAAWRDMNFTVDMNKFGAVLPGNYNVYLKIQGPKEQSYNLRCVRLANKGDIWDADLGANLIGTTLVY